MSRPQGIIFDLDGTLYRGSSPITGAAEAVHRLLRAGLQVRYFTNNSAITPAELDAKLRSMQFLCEPGWALGTAAATARFLTEETAIRRVFVLGSSALGETLADYGLDLNSDCHEGIVTGLDRGLTYHRLAEALGVLQSGARWIATNADATYPMDGGLTIPGAGAIVGALRGMGFEPEVVIGKPNAIGVQQLCQSMNLAPKEVLVVGDREETDLFAGRAAGTDVALVLSGVTSEARPGLSFWNDAADLRDVTVLAQQLLSSD